MKNFFFYNKFIYKEAPRFQKEDFARLKQKTEVGEKVDIDKLVSGANEVFSKYAERMAKFPDNVKNTIKQQLKSYFINAADSFDKDAETGLDKIEFRKYRNAMIQKMISTLNRHAPSKEQIEARKRIIEKKKKSADKLKKFVSKLDSISGESSDFNPENLKTPQGLNKEMEKLHTRNIKLADKFKEVQSLIYDARKEYANYQSLSGFKKGRQKISKLFVKNSDIFEADTTVTSVNSAIDKLKNPAVLRKLKKSKEKISKEGAFMIRAGKLMRNQIIESRNKALLMAANNPDKKKANKEKYEKYKKLKEKLLNRKNKLAETRTEFVMQKLEGRAHASDKMHTKAFDALSGAQDNLSNILSNPNLTEEQRKRIKLAIKQIDDKKVDLSEKQKTIKNVWPMEYEMKHQFVDAYIDKAFNPAISNIDSIIKDLDYKQLSNGSPIEKTQAQFGKMLEGIDTMNNALNETVLNLNITNSTMVSSLENGIKSLKKAKSPGWYTTVIDQFGGNAKLLFKKGIADNLSKWSKKIEKVGGPLKLVSFVLNTASGLSEGAGEFISGVSGLAARPKEAAKGFGALLVGRDPATGEWLSGETYSNAWGGLWKEMTASEKFGKGEYGKGTGKVLFNILTTVTGAGAIAKGAKGAKLAYLFSKNTMYQSRMVALTKAAKAFATNSATGAADTIYNIGSKWGGRFKRFGKAVYTGEIITKPARGLSRAMKAIPTTISEAAWKTKIAWHVGLKNALGTSEFYKKYKGFREKLSARKDIKREIKTQEKYHKRLNKNADKYGKCEAEINRLLKEKGITRDAAIRMIKRDKPEMYRSWENYTQDSVLLNQARRSLEVKMLGKELVEYRDQARSLGQYVDDIDPKHGRMKEFFEEYGIEKSLPREEALQQLKNKAQGPDKELADQWIAQEARFGNRAEKVISIQGEIKKMRGENYLHTESMIKVMRSKDPAGAKEAEKILRKIKELQKKGVKADDAELASLQSKLDSWKNKNVFRTQSPEYQKLKDAVIKQKLDELLETSGVDLKKELQLMDRTLYSKAGGIKKWNTEALKSADNYDTVKQSLNNHLEQFSRGKYAQLSRSDVNLIQNQLNEVISMAKKSGVKGEALVKLLNDSADKLLYQTIHSTKRQLGDHGIRHVAGNIRANLKAMEAYEKYGIKFSSKDKLQMMLGHINHDMGYTSSVALKSFGTTGAHPMISAAFLLDDSIAPVLKQVFGENHTRLTRGVLNHDGTEVLRVTDMQKLQKLKKLHPEKYNELLKKYKYNAFLNSMKYADNLALYSFDKLPPLFYKDKVCLNILVQIEHAGSGGNSFLVHSLKAQMKTRILSLRNQGKITRLESEGYLSAIDEVNADMSAKSTLGMLAGQHSDEVFSLLPDSESGRLIPYLRMEGSNIFQDLETSLHILRKADDATAAERIVASSRFDGATKQFWKIMEDYADKNGLTVKVGNKIIARGEDLTELGLDYLKQAIKEGKTLQFVKGKRTFMQVELKTATRSLTKYENRFAKVKTAEEKLALAKNGVNKIQRKIDNLDNRLKNASWKEKSKLLKQRQELRMQLQQMKDMEVAAEMLRDTSTLRNIKSIREFKEALKIKDNQEAIKAVRKLTRDKTLELTTNQQMLIEKTLSNRKLTNNEKVMRIAEIVERMDEKVMNKLFTKYKVESNISRQNITRYIKIGATASVGGALIYSTTNQ